MSADPPDGTKRCSKCGEVKPVAEFSRSSGTKDGRHAWCDRAATAILAEIDRKD